MCGFTTKMGHSRAPQEKYINLNLKLTTMKTFQTVINN